MPKYSAEALKVLHARLTPDVYKVTTGSIVCRTCERSVGLSHNGTPIGKATVAQAMAELAEHRCAGTIAQGARRHSDEDLARAVNATAGRTAHD